VRISDSIVTRLVNRCKDRLALEGWGIEWLWESGSGATHYATITPAFGSRMARMVLNEDQLSQYRTIYDSICHEMVHLVLNMPRGMVSNRLAEMDVMSEDALRVFTTLYTEAIEHSVADLTMALSSGYWEEDQDLNPERAKPKRRRKSR